MKIIYIFESRHCYNYDDKMFGLDAFRKRGWDVECWSAVNWRYEGIEVPLNENKAEYVRYIDSQDCLTRELERVKEEKCFFIVYAYHTYDHMSYTIRKNIKKYGFEFANQTESAAPMQLSIWQRHFCLTVINRTARELCMPFYQAARMLFPGRQSRADRIKIIKGHFCRYAGPLRVKSKFNFVETQIMYWSFPQPLEILSRRNRMLHAVDYDMCLETERLKPGKKYIVAVDQYQTGHSDLAKSYGRYAVDDEQEYYTKLNRLYSRLESVYGCEVIIAAHPKAEYKGSEYQGRKIVYNRTAELIRNAQLVVIETSTCFSIVALFKKDFLNIYSGEYFRNLPGVFEDTYEFLHKQFHCKSLDIEDARQIKQAESYVCHYDKKRYSSYVRQFVKSKGAIPPDGRRISEMIADILWSAGHDQ